MNEKKERLDDLIKELEKLKPLMWTTHDVKVRAELDLQKKEDEARSIALESNMPISKIPHHIKDKTQGVRMILSVADGNYKATKLKYDTIIELLNGLKFQIRLDIDMANNSNY